MSASPIDVVGQWMQNLLDPEVINRVLAPDATYVSRMVTYVQYLEDSYTTAASFRQDGCWTVQTEPAAQPFRV
jgi:hypothetical protein